MLDTGHYLQSMISLGHLPRRSRVKCLKTLCQAVRADLRHNGPDPRLMMLAVGLDYCASLIADAGDDPEGDAADAKLALLDDELRALQAVLKVGMYRPADPVAQRKAAQLLLLLRPVGAGWDSLSTARDMVQRCLDPEMQRSLDALCCRPMLVQVEVSLGDAEGALLHCQRGTVSELLQRARGATRFADELLRRMLGHIAAVTDADDEGQRVRARSLLHPVEEIFDAPLRSLHGRPEGPPLKELR